jgi:hypothetical protein
MSYDTDAFCDPPSDLRHGSFGLAGFAPANLCRIGNRLEADEKMGIKMPATIWRSGANKGKAQSSSARTEGGMHDCSDVDTPLTGKVAFPGLTGSALFPSVDRMTRAPVLRSV